MRTAMCTAVCAMCTAMRTAMCMLYVPGPSNAMGFILGVFTKRDAIPNFFKKRDAIPIFTKRDAKPGCSVG